MKKTKHISHQDSFSQSLDSSGDVGGGISLGEFIGRVNEESSLGTPVTRGFKGLMALIISILSLGMFKNLIG